MDAELSRGTLIDKRYRVDRRVGQGAFGAVYEAEHVDLGTRVALKVHRTDHASSERSNEALAAFLEEGRTLARLRHRGIVSVLDAGVIDHAPYFVMEWCDGPTLQVLVAERAPLSANEAWKTLAPICEAVAHAHAQGVVHRDLKPSNVVLDGGAPRVIDFGIAKWMAEGEDAGTGDTLTTGRTAFTPRYAAPEQIAGARTGPWSDVYALALIFLELVIGPHALDVDERGALLDPKALRASLARASADRFARVVTRALAVRPADRFADAGDFLAAMQVANTNRHFAKKFGALAVLIFVVSSALVARYAWPSHAVTHVSTVETITASSSATLEPSASAPPSASSIASSAPPVVHESVKAPASAAPASSSIDVEIRPGLTRRLEYRISVSEQDAIGNTRTIPSIVALGPSMRACFPAPTPRESWSVDLTIKWPKGQAPDIWRTAVRDDLAANTSEVRADAPSERIASCVEAKLRAANVPAGGDLAHAAFHIGYVHYKVLYE